MALRILRAMINTQNETPTKTVLITGAAKRIGRAIAVNLAEAGWDIAVHCNRSETDAQALADDLQKLDVRAQVFVADLSDEAAVQALIPAVDAAIGPVQALVNNASVFEDDSPETADRASWDLHMETNLRAPFVLIQEMARRLPKGMEGNVVNLLDQRVWSLTPHFMSYTLSKAGLWTLTQTFAMALAPDIRVNAIGPGPVLPSIHQTEDQFARQWSKLPLRRQVMADEIADGVRFLLNAPSMTGQMIALDGGQHLGWAQPSPDEPPEG